MFVGDPRLRRQPRAPRPPAAHPADRPGRARGLGLSSRLGSGLGTQGIVGRWAEHSPTSRLAASTPNARRRSRLRVADRESRSIRYDRPMSTIAMDEKGVIVSCPSCGQRNRVPFRHGGASAASAARPAGRRRADRGARRRGVRRARRRTRRCRSSSTSGRRGAVRAAWSRPSSSKVAATNAGRYARRQGEHRRAARARRALPHPLDSDDGGVRRGGRKWRAPRGARPAADIEAFVRQAAGTLIDATGVAMSRWQRQPAAVLQPVAARLRRVRRSSAILRCRGRSSRGASRPSAGSGAADRRRPSTRCAAPFGARAATAARTRSPTRSTARRPLASPPRARYRAGGRRARRRLRRLPAPRGDRGLADAPTSAARSCAAWSSRAPPTTG